MTILQAVVRGDVVNPATLFGALFYAIAFLVLARLMVSGLRAGVNRLVQRPEHGLVDRTTVTFLLQLAQGGIYILMLTLYAHLIPALRSMGTALLTGVSVASVVFGLAAQNTLANLVAGVSLLLYRPFRVGDHVQVSAPTGVEAGVVESLTLGYTIVVTSDDRRVVIPNSVMASQVTINLTAKDRR
jgi:small conductance mechanosensitive channel